MDYSSFYSSLLINRILSKEEQNELFKKFNNGCDKSLDILVRCNLKLVYSIAKKYKNLGLEFEDLLSAGHIGLIKAIRKFDVSKNTLFSTYAYYWIRLCIIREIQNTACVIRKPINFMDIQFKFSKFKEGYYFDNGEYPTMETISKFMDISITKVKEIERFNDREIGNIEDFHEVIPIKQDGITLISCIIDLDYILSSLSEENRKIFCRHYGILGNNDNTIRELSEDLGYSKIKISKTVNKCLSKIKKIIVKDINRIHEKR